MPTEKATENKIEFKSPGLSDGAGMYGLVDACKPLDLNSPYLYLLLAHHYPETCVLAVSGSESAGLLTGYIPPQKPDTIFIWQIAVRESARGQGLAARMLEEVLKRPVCRNVKYLECTVTPSNASSRRLFQGFAKRHGAPLEETELLRKEHFGGEGHEEENLFRIGPLR